MPCQLAATKDGSKCGQHDDEPVEPDPKPEPRRADRFEIEYGLRLFVCDQARFPPPCGPAGQPAVPPGGPGVRLVDDLIGIFARGLFRHVFKPYSDTVTRSLRSHNGNGPMSGAVTHRLRRKRQSGRNRRQDSLVTGITCPGRRRRLLHRLPLNRRMRDCTGRQKGRVY